MYCFHNKGRKQKCLVLGGAVSQNTSGQFWLSPTYDQQGSGPLSAVVSSVYPNCLSAYTPPLSSRPAINSFPSLTEVTKPLILNAYVVPKSMPQGFLCFCTWMTASTSGRAFWVGGTGGRRQKRWWAGASESIWRSLGEFCGGTNTGQWGHSSLSFT